MNGIVLLRLRVVPLALVLACASSPAPAPTESPTAAVGEPEAASEERESAPAHTGPWWTASEPVCVDSSELVTRKLTWGRLAWCARSRARLDARLRLDLGRIGKCIHAAVGVLQSEPEPAELGTFLVKAAATELLPGECAMVELDRHKKRVLTYRGAQVEMDRRVLGEARFDDGTGNLTVEYRFSCAECAQFAAAEISLATARP